MTILLLIIVLALIFDYINGFHDAANAIATIVATKVLTPFQAVVWAAFLISWPTGYLVSALPIPLQKQPIPWKLTLR